MSIERTLAAEREAHFDGDAWRAHCGESIRGPGPITRGPALPPRICGCGALATTARYDRPVVSDLCDPCAAKYDAA